MRLGKRSAGSAPAALAVATVGVVTSTWYGDHPDQNWSLTYI